MSIDALIRKKQTGTLDELAKKTGVTKRKASKYLDCMKDYMDAPIIYNEEIKSYEYTNEGQLSLEWKKA